MAINVSGIYAIACLQNNRMYIGSAVMITKRWRDHREDLRAGRHHNQHLQFAWNKYGEHAFDFRILEVCPRDDLIVTEQRYLDQADKDTLFNVNPYATSNRGRRWSPEVRTRMGRHNKGRRLTPEHRAKVSASLLGNTRLLGYRHSPETIQHLRELGRQRGAFFEGGTHTAEAKRKIGDHFRDKPLSVVHRQRIATSLSGRQQTVEHRRNISKSQRMLTDEQIAEIRRALTVGESMKSIGLRVGCSAQTVCNIKHDRIEVYRESDLNNCAIA